MLEVFVFQGFFLSTESVLFSHSCSARLSAEKQEESGVHNTFRTEAGG